MQLEAATQEIQALLLGIGKEFKRMDPVVKDRFETAIETLLAVESVDDLQMFGKFNLKFFNSQFQINIGPEKRLRFTSKDDTITLEFFGSTSHKGE